MNRLLGHVYLITILIFATSDAQSDYEAQVLLLKEISEATSDLKRDTLKHKLNQLASDSINTALNDDPRTAATQRRSDAAENDCR